MPAPSVTDGLTRVLISHTSLTGQVIVGMTRPVLGSAALKNIGDFLQRSLNLSDLTDVVAARNNLGLGTAATHNVGPHVTRGPGLPNEVVLFRHLGDAAYANVSEITALFPEVPDTFLDLTDTPDDYSDGALLFSRGDRIDYARGAKSASWNGSNLGVLGSLAVNGGIGIDGGVITALVGEGVSLAPVLALYKGYIAYDPDPTKFFADYATNATTANPAGIRKVAFDMAGTGYAVNTVLQAADYAEWFEGDHNIPVGSAVVIGHGGVRAYDPATDQPTDIVGVVRPRATRAALIGNAAEHHWAGMYVVDDFGEPIMSGGSPVLNPNYDPSLPYIARSKRPEWNLIGLLGQIPVRVGQPVHPSWKKLRPISAQADLYLVIR